MPTLHVVVLALVQGITEFLPISSSGHLVLVPALTGWADQGLMMDVAVHVGTLGAVMLYFWRDIGAMVGGLARLAKGRSDAGARLAGHVALASIPVGLAGFFGAAYIEATFRSVALIGWTTLGFGLLLWLADKVGMTVRRIEHMGWIDSLVIGLAQVLALVPGTSRSGITMTAARFLGFERPDSARFSMLMSIPVIAAAGGLAGWHLWRAGDVDLTEQVATAAGLAFVAALVTIALLMVLLKRTGFGIFVIYRVILGCGLLAWAYFW